MDKAKADKSIERFRREMDAMILRKMAILNLCRKHYSSVAKLDTYAAVFGISPVVLEQLEREYKPEIIMAEVAELRKLLDAG